MKPLPPTVFVVGVRKCGTTTLFDSLAAHPDFHAARVKEPQFFAQPDATVTGHLDWYDGLWERDQEGMRLDGSTLYYQFPAAYERIQNHVRRAVFLCCLRDPAKRFFSAYWHLRAKPGGIETRQFDDLLDAYEKQLAGKGSPEMAEQSILEDALTKGQIKGDYLGGDYLRTHYGAPFTTELPDPLIFFRYLRESRYHRTYAQFAAQAATHVVLFERLTGQPREELADVLAFLSATHAGNHTAEHQFELAPNNNRTLNANRSLVMRTLAGLGLYNGVKRLLKDRQKQWIKRNFYGGIPAMTHEQYERTRRLLTDEYAFWAEELPQTQQLWQF